MNVRKWLKYFAEVYDAEFPAEAANARNAIKAIDAAESKLAARLAQREQDVAALAGLMIEHKGDQWFWLDTQADPPQWRAAESADAAMTAVFAAAAREIAPEGGQQ